MKRNKKIILLLIGILLVIALCKVTYARYVLTRNFDVQISSLPFYFDASLPSSTVVFTRTSDTSDYDTILTDVTDLNILIKNNDGTNYNSYETTYTATVLDSQKFTFETGDTVTKTIGGGSKKDETVAFKLKIKDFTKTDKTVKIRVSSTSPYQKSFDFTVNVVQEGAIQTIEDLLDLSLEIRGSSSKSTRAQVINQRFKLTRDLDFKNQNSYENYARTDYNNTNLDSLTENLYNEMNNTSGAGFLPIGLAGQPFQGVFNGGGHTISNLFIHKSLQADIGLFGFTVNSTIKNLVIENGSVTNENQNAGMIVGKAQGGLLADLEVKGTVVESKDMAHTAEDTYTGGIVGFIEKDATIQNCINRATVITLFNGDTSLYAGAAGGITAWAAHTDIINCQNYGSVTGQSYVGGIAGFFGMQVETGGAGGGTLRDSTNYGKIDTNSTGKHIGGIAGYNKAGALVTNNTNAAGASVHGVQNVGGIVGNNAGNLTNNKNYSSSISGTSRVGHIYGYSNGSYSGNNDYA